MSETLKHATPEVLSAVAADQRRERRLSLRDTSLSILTPILLLLLWELAARWGWIDSRIFTSPTMILQTGWNMVLDGSLATHVGATVYRLLLGFTGGAVAGIVVGLIMGVIRPLRAAFGPTFTALYALPMIAILPLLLLIFGLTETPRILAVAISVFFVLFINSVSAIIQIDARLLEAANAYNAHGLRLFRAVLLPAAIPTIATGLRVAAGMAVTVVTAVEFVASNAGLGYIIWNSWQLFQPAVMFVGLICVAILGAVFTGALIILERKVAPWNNHTNG